MTAEAYIQDIPYDDQRMVLFAINAGGLAAPSSFEGLRELVDAVIQSYIDSYHGEIDGYVLDNVEDTIVSLLSDGPNLEPRTYDTGLNALRRLALVRERGARALQGANYPIVKLIESTETKGVATTHEQAESITQKREREREELRKTLVETTNHFDDIVITLLEENRINNSTAAAIMSLFQLRDSINLYSQERNAIKHATESLFTLLMTVLDKEPMTKGKNNSRIFLDKELEEGKSIIYALKELLKLPETISSHPFDVYVKSRARESDGILSSRIGALKKAQYIIEYAFRETTT